MSITMQWPLYFFLTRPQASKNGFLIRYEDRIFSIFKAQGFSSNMNNEGYKYFFVDLVTSSKIRISLVETRIVPDITLNENVETVLVRLYWLESVWR